MAAASSVSTAPQGVSFQPQVTGRRGPSVAETKPGRAIGRQVAFSYLGPVEANPHLVAALRYHVKMIKPA